MFDGWHIDSRCHLCVVCHDDYPPLVVVNKVGLPQITKYWHLKKFPHSHAFKDGSFRMTLDSNSSNMEEPNVIEWKQAMNFYTSITIVPNIFERVCRQILGKFWASYGLSLHDWVFSLVLIEPTHLA